MKTDIFQIDTFVEVNSLKAVTNPIYLNPDRTPTSNGIFSFEIFGTPGTRDRKERFGYIDLNAHVIHPFLYKHLVQMDRKIRAVAEGMNLFKVDKAGDLAKAEEGDKDAGTGLEWLYSVFKTIKWKPSGTKSRDTKISMFRQLKVDEIFVTKWPIIPCHYRDLNFAKLDTGRIGIGEVNEFYVRVLGASEAVKRNPPGLGLVGHSASYRMQTVLVELYDHLMSRMTFGKRGYIRRFLMGKNLDYTARVVITTSKMSEADRYTDTEVPLSHMGVPLHICCVAFQPFVVKAVQEMLGSILAGKRRIIMGQKSVEGIDLLSENISDDGVEQMISMFARSQEERFSPILLEDAEGNKTELKLFEQFLGRSFTVCDLLFLACREAIKGKYMYITRYPVTSHQSTNVVKPVIVTTEKTTTIDFTPGGTAEGRRSILGKIDNYPDINYGHLWREAAVMDNTMTGITGADFDGDQMSLVGMFTQEANAEAEKIMKSKMSLVTADGRPSRNVSNEAVLSLYMMTKD